jgi:hypothetical protein
MTDFAKLRAELKTHRDAAAKVVHPDMGGTAEQMATVNAAYDQALKDIALREQEELAQTQAQPKARGGNSTWTPVHDDPSPPKEYPDTTKGRVHRAYDEHGLSGAIKVAKALGVKPQRFKRWREDFKFSEEWE